MRVRLVRPLLAEIAQLDYLCAVIGGLDIAYVPAGSPFPAQHQVNRVGISLSCRREEAQQGQPHCRC